MEELRTLGKYSIKPYRCTNCGNEEEHGTNHWGEFYNTRCRACGTFAIWECLEEPPKGFKKPTKWKNKPNLKSYIHDHIKAVGPVGINNIIEFLEEQWPGKLKHLAVHRAVADMERQGIIEVYDNDPITWW